MQAIRIAVWVEKKEVLCILILQTQEEKWFAHDLVSLL